MRKVCGLSAAKDKQTKTVLKRDKDTEQTEEMQSGVCHPILKRERER